MPLSVKVEGNWLQRNTTSPQVLISRKRCARILLSRRAVPCYVTVRYNVLRLGSPGIVYFGHARLVCWCVIFALFACQLTDWLPVEFCTPVCPLLPLVEQINRGEQ